MSLVLTSRVKEKIILQSPQDISGYVVTVYAENLTARLLENREIEFVSNDNEVIFTMTSPYMYDGVGELSEDITVEMIQKGTGIYFICMTPDAQWLNDESRVYPVVIDPQVSTSTVQQNIIDNYVLEGSGVQNYNLDRLYIGIKSGCHARAFIQFATMPTIASGNIILSAEMTVQLLAGTSTAQNIGAYIVTEADWSSGTITWDNQPDATIVLHPIIGHNNLTNYNFTCLEAVERWYTGMPNGQYQNYGIMLRYSNESIADYNSVYSADCTDAAKRPVMTINYQSSLEEFAINEGATYTLSVQSTSAVTWASSNTAVATVSSSGVVTGIKSGKTTITATANGTTLHSSTVYVKLQNGVYRIKNGASNVYIGTAGSIVDGTVTSLKTKSTSGYAQLWQLWKITYLDKGYYSIRPLYKLDTALGLNGANVSLYTIGTTDSYSAVPSANYWTISADTLGYAIKRGGSNGLAMAPSSDTPASGTAVVVGGYSSTNTARHWSFEKVSSPPAGAYLYDSSTHNVVTSPTKYIMIGESRTLEDYNLIPISYSSSTNSQTFTWSVSGDNSIVTVNSSTGEVTGISAGTATIIGTGYAGTVQFYIEVLAVEDGTYFIRNKHSDKYVDIWNSTMQSGTDIVHWNLEGDNTQKWIITHLGDGTYSIKSANSSTAYYLGVSGDSSANEQSVVLRTGSLTDGMKWKINKTTSGAYKFTPLSGQSNNRVLALELNVYGSQNGDILYQRDYVADASYEDEWYLCKQKDYTLMYLGEHEDDPSMPAILESVEDALINNAQMSGYANTSMTTVEIMEHLASSRIFSCITHGNQTGIATSDGELTINDVNSLPNSVFDDLVLVCITACRTGSVEDDTTNLVDTLYSKGVDTVIGFKVGIDVDASDYWTEQFMLSLAEGNTVYDAMTAADMAVDENDNLTDIQAQTVSSDNRYVLGSTTIAPCD